jgi:hypothetical protein
MADAYPAAREPFQGYRQTSDYGYWSYLAGNPLLASTLVVEFSGRSAVQGAVW